MSALKIKLQVMCGNEIAMGPGKADLLEAIARERSISGAGRAMGMSYRRAWLLVDTMNRCWHEPLVHAAPGRSASGGARLTAAGAAVLGRYRALEAAAEAGCAEGWGELAGMVLGVARERQGGKVEGEE